MDNKPQLLLKDKAKLRFSEISGNISSGTNRSDKKRYRASFTFRGKIFTLTVTSKHQAWQFLLWAEHEATWNNPTVKVFRWWLEEFRDLPSFPPLVTWYWRQQ